MAKLKAAWIGFRNPDVDPWVLYEQRAKVGFKAMDGDLSMMEGDPVENLKRFRDLGLETLCSGIGRSNTMAEIAADSAKVKEIVERAHFYDNKYVNIGMSSVISSFGSEYGNNGTYDQLMADVEGMNAIVKVLNAEGLIPLYHNHYQEFTVTYDGVSVMDILLREVDHSMKMKLDVGWVYVGGVDPVEYLEKIKERVGLVHIKDFTEQIKPRYLVNADKTTDFGFVSVGAGVLDLPAILQKALDIGQEWAIVEQDRVRNLSLEDSLLCGYFNMKETDLVE